MAFLGGTIGNLDRDRAARILRALRGDARARGPAADRHRPGQGPRPAGGRLQRLGGRDRGVQPQRAARHQREPRARTSTPTRFEHVAFYDEHERSGSRCGCVRASRTRRASRSWTWTSTFERGEEIRTEISCKFTRARAGARVRRRRARAWWAGTPTPTACSRSRCRARRRRRGVNADRTILQLLPEHARGAAWERLRRAGPAEQGAPRAAIRHRQHGHDADGRAALGGRTKALSSDADRELFHRLREQVDAVMAGVATIAHRELRAARPATPSVVSGGVPPDWRRCRSRVTASRSMELPVRRRCSRTPSRGWWC